MLLDKSPSYRSRLRTPIDQAIDGLTGTMARALGGELFDRASQTPLMIGPGGWTPGARFDTRTDSWVNGVTGFGTSLDKTMAGWFQPTQFLSDSSLEAMYHGDDITERMIGTVPREMLRKGYGLQLGDKPDSDNASKILDACEELGLNEKLIEVLTWARLFGDGALVIGADDGRPPILPLMPELVRKIDWLQAYDRRYYAINSYYSSGPKQGAPETYALGNPGMVASPLMLVHESRLIRFAGVPTTQHFRQIRGGFNISALQRSYEVIRSFATGFKAVEILLTDGPQAVFKIKGLAQLLGSNNQQLFQDRIQAVDMFRSVMRAVVVDSESEDFTREAFNFSGVPDVLEKLGLRLAASVPMPYAKLMGQGPAGMNATGDGDFRDWYDGIETDRTNKLSRPLRQFIQILCATREGPTGGAVPPSIKIEFPPLWTLNPKEEAERRSAIATADKLYFDMGVATAEEIALSRFTDRGYSGETINIDRDLRETLVEQDREEQLAEPAALPPADVIDPTIVSVVATVDEARAALGMPADEDPEVGAMKVAELAAKSAATTQPGAHATDPEQNKPDGFPPQDPTEKAAQAHAQALAVVGANGAAPPGGAKVAGNAPPANPNKAGAPGPTGAKPKAPPAK